LVWFESTYGIAVKYQFEEEKDEAVKYMGTIKSFLSEFYYKSGFNFYRKNRYDAAYAEYRKALDYKPNNVAAASEYEKLGRLLSEQYYERGMSYYTKSEMKNAKENFIKALQYDPSNSAASRALERLGNY
jgi:tetratricopeptide (TPR) repeat protein